MSEKILVPAAEAAQFLYRHFDRDGRLLYVGISSSALRRLDEHKGASHWFHEIANITISSFGTRAEVLLAERNAVQDERPLHNLKLQRKDGQQEIKPTKGEVSKVDLVRRMVNFHPTYTMQQAAIVLNLSPSSIKKLMNSGELGFVEMGRRCIITGWQLIDFIQYLELKAKL